MIVVGLTGGIGSGKSTVSALLAARGAVVLDADAITHELQQPGTPVFDAMVSRFGPSIVASDGTLDRAALASVVFEDRAALADLQGIVWPAVGAEMARRMSELEGTDSVVVLDIPLLAESGRQRDWKGVIVVDAPVEVCVSRLVSQRGMSETDARARVANQASREERLARADIVIDNSGSLEDLEAEIAKVWDWIQSLRS